MNIILAFFVVLVLSVGNFIPFMELDFSMLIIKSLLMIGVLTLLIVTKREPKVYLTPFIYFLTITLIFSLLVLRSQDIGYAVDKYFSLTVPVLFAYYFFTELVNKLGEYSAFKYVVISGFFILILTIIYKIIFGFWEREVRFFLNGSIVFGWMMAMYSLLSFYLFKYNNEKKYGVLGVVFFFSVLWAESKGPILGYFLALVFYLALDSRASFKLFLISFAALILFFSDNIINLLEKYLINTRLSALVRILKGDVSNQDEGSITVRQDMAFEAFNLFLNNTFGGIGLGNYQFHTAYGFMYPHNIHLEIFMECGIFIGVLYLMFLLFCFFNSPKILKSLIILFFVCGCFSGDITYLRFLIFVCLIGLFLNKFNNYSARINL